MRATEMHDLLKKAYDALNVDVFQPGHGDFKHINYCRYCHYSMAHAHGPDCLLTQLEREVAGSSPNGACSDG